MIKYLPGYILVLLCFLTGSCQAQDKGLKLVIIRHAEKPSNGENLNCQGLNRSIQLPSVINKKFGVPSLIYVPKMGTGNVTKRSRAFQTVLPLAVKSGLSVNSSFDVDDSKGLANEILSKTGEILICWEHNELTRLVHAIGIKSKQLKWPDGDYDSIWVITFVNGKPKLTLDSEGLKPASSCSF